MSAANQVARQWIAKAKNDLLSADNNLAAAEVPYDAVCFHCQQAAEKLLKAYVVAQGQAAPRTHDLLAILENILTLSNTAEELREPLSLLMPYSVAIRYPDDWFMPSEEDAREARDAADKVLNWLRSVLGEVFLGPANG